MPRLRCLPLCLLALVPVAAQRLVWQPQPSPSTASLRGLSVVSARLAWASGSGGAVLRTRDGGAHWTRIPAPGAANLDFRDIKAFSARLAYLMAIGPQGGIFKTSDGGAHWREQYTNPDPAFFLDALAFWDANHGLALGDPLDGRFLLLRTDDGGQSWQPAAVVPPALPGEGAFAASGTALVVLPGHPHGHPDAWFATGGAGTARLFHSLDRDRTWRAATTPLRAGSAGAGIFSLAFWNRSDGVAVGGDYTQPSQTAGNVALTEDGGARWNLPPAAPPAGYRSAVAVVPGARPHPWLVAVGPTGADLSCDGGNHWSPVSARPLNSIAFAPDGSGWAVGPRGAVVHVTLAAPAPRSSRPAGCPPDPGKTPSTPPPAPAGR
ncbi:MAG TPA: hypothetical protein VNF74_13630 [Terriglobales bacterium]|nr:hypothetical protein [Terriglobales bacterium]